MQLRIRGMFSEARYFDMENPAVAIVADPLGFVPNQKKKSDLVVLDDFSRWPKGVHDSSNHQIRVEKIGVKA